MSRDGYVNGFPVPPLFGHNMDDPRSPDYKPVEPVSERAPGGLTAVRLGFETGEEYATWIAADARQRQRLPFGWQLAIDRILVGKGRFASLLRRAIRPFVPTMRLVPRVPGPIGIDPLREQGTRVATLRSRQYENREETEA